MSCMSVVTDPQMTQARSFGCRASMATDAALLPGASTTVAHQRDELSMNANSACAQNKESRKQLEETGSNQDALAPSSSIPGLDLR